MNVSVFFLYLRHAKTDVMANCTGYDVSHVTASKSKHFSEGLSRQTTAMTACPFSVVALEKCLFTFSCLCWFEPVLDKRGRVDGESKKIIRS